MKLLTVFGIVLLLGVAAVITDCSCGSTQAHECQVVHKYYKPPWEQVSVTTDADGMVSVDTIDHPEEWHVVTTKEFNIKTTATIFHSVTNDQWVIVNTREGKWSKAQYLPSIQL